MIWLKTRAHWSIKPGSTDCCRSERHQMGVRLFVPQPRPRPRQKEQAPSTLGLRWGAMVWRTPRWQAGRLLSGGRRASVPRWRRAVGMNWWTRVKNQNGMVPRSGMRRLCRSWWVIAVVSIFSATVLASCVGPSDYSTTGYVAGVVYSRSGINPNPQAVEGAEVIATQIGSDSEQTYTTTTVSNGSFNFDLPPGTYELNATTTTKLYASPEKVTVAAGTITNVEVYINIP